MAIEVNDWVVHPQHGVGRVVKMEVKGFGTGPAQRYYEVALGKGTIWVPVDGARSGLRKLTPKDDLGKYRGLLRGRPTPLATDHRLLQIALAERWKESSFQARCEIVRDLTAHRWHKPLNENSSAMLRTAHEVLCAEWAVAEGLSLSEATSEVEALLLEGRKAYKP